MKPHPAIFLYMKILSPSPEGEEIMKLN